MVKIFSYASLEVIVGAIVLYFNLKAFLLYFLVIYLVNSHLRTESLAKAIRVHATSSAIADCAIIQKLGITNEELKESTFKLKAKVDPKNWELLMKDYEVSNWINVL